MTSEKARPRRSTTSPSELGVGEEEVLDALHSENAARRRSCRRTTTSAASAGSTCPSRRPGSPLRRPDHARRRAAAGSTSGSAGSCTLRFDEGLTQSQIAAQLGISQMHVSRLLRRSLETLRQAVGDIEELD